MSVRKKKKYIHTGKYVAEVEVSLLEDQSEWGPYLSVEDALKLDNAREALRKGDIRLASTFGQVYELHPVSQ